MTTTQQTAERRTAPTAQASPMNGGRLPSYGGLELSTDDVARLPAKLQWTLVARYRAADELEAAAAVLDVIARRAGETVRELEERARLAFAAGQIDEAQNWLEERARRAPSPSAQVALGRLHLEAGRIEEARQISEAISRTHLGMVTVDSLAADVALAFGKRDTARSYFHGLVDARPDHGGALLSLARLAIEDGDQTAAGHFLRRACSAAGDNATPLQLTTAADLAADLGQSERAAELQEQAKRVEEARTAEFVAAVREELGDPAESPEYFPELEPAPPATPASPGPAAAASGPDVDDIAGEAPTEAAVPAWDAEADTTLIDPRTLEILRRDFGHRELRPGQAAVIAKVLAGQDALAIMPTGAGKSLTFQLPAMLLDGTTLVISPLIALMKDQVESLPPAVRARTALINSTLTAEEMRDRLDELAAGLIKLVYVAPERLRHHAFLRALRTAGVALVVVDEAHCISMWGHDFRPDYLTIPKSLPELGQPSILAITATATPAIANQIGAGLGRELDVVRVSLFRPNLFYEAHQLKNREEKVSKVIEICRQERGSGIVYVSSRKDAEAIARLLGNNRVQAIPYHAGLEPDVRARNQERFMRGQVRVVVATVAFGMGVDKADVRFIVHLNPPSSLEAYAQESGRAGRDRQPARCVLLVAPTDESNLRRRARRDETELETLRRVYAGLKRAAAGNWAIVDPSTLLPPDPEDPDDEPDPRIALGLLEQAKLILRHPDAPVSYTLWRRPAAAPDGEEGDDGAWSRLERWLGPERSGNGGIVRTAEACTAMGLTPIDLDRLLSERPNLDVRPNMRLVCLQILPAGRDASATLTTLLERARQDARRRIRQVMDYASGRRCRHAALAAHLGEKLDPCGTVCDVCTGSAATAKRVEDRVPARNRLTANDAFAVIEAARTLPFPMGKTGLARLLLGSVESSIREDRSQAFGALAGLTRGKVDGLIDRLVADGLLYRDLNHEYKVISLTPRGAEATVASLADYDEPNWAAPAASKSAGQPSREIEDADLSPEDAELLRQLFEWRRQRAIAEGMPPYVIAHNSTLRNLAVARPATVSALGSVPGLGPAKIDKYGDELLRLIAEA